jgi:predicted site-specific integrase-resolvase
MMTSEKPRVTPDGRYSQTEAARALGVDRHTVARYEKQGLLRFRVRKAGRCKVTTGQEIMKCWTNCYM